MPRTLLAEIVTPEAIVYTNEVQMVVASTANGEIGILPLHAPIVTTLAPGEVRLHYGEGASEWEYFSISGGYLQVHEDKVIVLADNAVPVSQIDSARLKESAELIQTRLAELPPEAASDERQAMIRDLDWAQTQLRTAERRGGK
jgi:F-type H+-transporting ATPase subunit epsilon